MSSMMSKSFDDTDIESFSNICKEGAEFMIQKCGEIPAAILYISPESKLEILPVNELNREEVIKTIHQMRNQFSMLAHVSECWMASHKLNPGEKIDPDKYVQPSKDPNRIDTAMIIIYNKEKVRTMMNRFSGQAPNRVLTKWEEFEPNAVTGRLTQPPPDWN